MLENTRFEVEENNTVFIFLTRSKNMKVQIKVNTKLNRVHYSASRVIINVL